MFGCGECFTMGLNALAVEMIALPVKLNAVELKPFPIVSGSVYAILVIVELSMKEVEWIDFFFRWR